MVLKTVKLDPITWQPPNAPIELITGLEAVAQYIKQRLLLWKGEYFLDTTRGVDYGKYLGGKKFNDELTLIHYLNNTKYVKRVVELTATPDKATRQLSIYFTVETDYGLLKGEI